ncbi:hypothetical protein KQX54_012577, partial [Cotesia glomerata]
SKCINCGGSHRSLDRACPKVREANEISEIIAYDNLMYMQAKKLYEAKGRVPASAPDMTLLNFPPLKQNLLSGQRPPLNQSFMGSSNTAETVIVQLKKTRETEITPPSEMSNKAVHYFLEMINNISNQETLWQRIWKVLSLHITQVQPQAQIQTQNGSRS